MSSSADRFVPAFGLSPDAPTTPPPAPQTAVRTGAEAAAAVSGIAAGVMPAVTVTDLDANPASTARFDIALGERLALPPDLYEKLRAEAQAAGYATGWAQGRREAEVAAQATRDQVAAETRQAAAVQATRVQQALGAVVGAASQLEQRMVPTCADLEDLIVNTAYALAEAVIGRELATAVEPGRDAIARALALAPADRPVTVRLHPNDYATVTDGQPATVQLNGRDVNLVADYSLLPGDAVAECDATTVDARIQPALNRVREVLGL
jgi:flagellar assembly protein FliH